LGKYDIIGLTNEMNMTLQSPTRFGTNEAINYLIDKFCPLQNAAILDVGCGKGGYHQLFSLRGIKGAYLGIDIKERESWQRKRDNGLQISFMVHNAEKLSSLQQKFNFIIAIQSLEHIRRDSEAIAGMKMCLRDGGYILLTVPSKYSFCLYPFHGYRRYSISEIRRLAHQNGLDIKEIIRIGGLSNFFLHIVLWTIPAVLFRIKIWQFYQKSKLLTGLINKLERFSLSFDKVFGFLEGGYGVVLRKV